MFTLLLGLLARPPATDCRRHHALCALLGDQTGAFLRELWFLRQLRLSDPELRTAVLHARRERMPSAASWSPTGPLELYSYTWRAHGVSEQLVIGRSWEEQDPGIWTPAAHRFCLGVQSSHRPLVCAHEDMLVYTTWRPVRVERAWLVREDGETLGGVATPSQ